MSSNLKVNNILPSTGANIGLGTASGTLNVDGGCKVQVGTALTLGHTQGVQFHTQNLHSTGFEINQINASGIITASHFYGNGANLTGLTSVGGATGVDFNDNVKVRLGTGNDLELYHNGTDSYIANATNNFRIGNTGSTNLKFFTNDSTRWNIDGNGHFIPDSNNNFDIGSSSARVRDLYTGDLNLSNEGRTNEVDNTWGDYSIQEGENDLFLINSRNGKKYKFLFQEVD